MRKLINEFNNINESSLNRIYSHIQKYECAIITAFKGKLTNCRTENDNEKRIYIRQNKDRNKLLKSALLFFGYQITKVKGTYVE